MTRLESRTETRELEPNPYESPGVEPRDPEEFDFGARDKEFKKNF